MAPEQLEGKEADARTDLWALGALLYEMVTGKRAFEARQRREPHRQHHETEPAGLATLQPLTPPALERVVTHCLAKHPDDRWDTAHDVADELRWIAKSSSSSVAGLPGRSRHRAWLTPCTLWPCPGGCAGSGPLPGREIGHGRLGATARNGGGNGRAPCGGTAAGRSALARARKCLAVIRPLARRDNHRLHVRSRGRHAVVPAPHGLQRRVADRRFRGSPPPRVFAEWPVRCVLRSQFARRPCDSLKRVSVTDGRVDALGTAPEGDILTTLEWTPSGTILLTGSVGDLADAGGWWSGHSYHPKGIQRRENFAFAASLPGDRQLIFPPHRQFRQGNAGRPGGDRGLRRTTGAPAEREHGSLSANRPPVLHAGRPGRAHGRGVRPRTPRIRHACVPCGNGPIDGAFPA